MSMDAACCFSEPPPGGARCKMEDPYTCLVTTPLAQLKQMSNINGVTAVMKTNPIPHCSRTVSFNKTGCGNPPGSLVISGMPHHRDTLPKKIPFQNSGNVCLLSTDFKNNNSSTTCPLLKPQLLQDSSQADFLHYKNKESIREDNSSRKPSVDNAAVNENIYLKPRTTFHVSRKESCSVEDVINLRPETVSTQDECNDNDLHECKPGVIPSDTSLNNETQCDEVIVNEGWTEGANGFLRGKSKRKKKKRKKKDKLKRPSTSMCAQTKRIDLIERPSRGNGKNLNLNELTAITKPMKLLQANAYSKHGVPADYTAKIKLTRSVDARSVLPTKAMQDLKLNRSLPHSISQRDYTTTALLPSTQILNQVKNSLISQRDNSVPSLRKVTKVYLSEKQSASLRELGLEIPCAPPATPQHDMMERYDYVASLSDVRAQRAVKMRLENILLRNKQKQQQAREAQLRNERLQEREREKGLKRRQRQEIYALNKVMTEHEHSNFEKFCKEHGLEP